MNYPCVHQSRHLHRDGESSVYWKKWCFLGLDAMLNHRYPKTGETEWLNYGKTIGK